MRRRIVAGNWKMNGSRDLVSELAGQVRSATESLDNGVEIVIIPPALFASDAIAELSGSAKVGVQNVARWQAGAYTGEIAAGMAWNVGCEYALVGHSERRQLFGESDDIVAEKVAQVLASGLNLMLCVGETLSERESGAAEAVVKGQIRKALAGVNGNSWCQVVIAYEPVWAIGTGKTATAGDAQGMHREIRALLGELGAPADEISLLYGGSVKPDNAAELFAQPDIDGGLIGGASLVAEDFLSICQAVPGRT